MDIYQRTAKKHHIRLRNPSLPRFFRTPSPNHAPHPHPAGLGVLLKDRHALHPRLHRLLLAHHTRSRAGLQRVQHAQERAGLVLPVDTGHRVLLDPMVRRGLHVGVRRRGRRCLWRLELRAAPRGAGRAGGHDPRDSV